MTKISHKNRKENLKRNGTQSSTKASKNTYSHPMNQTAQLYLQRHIHRI